MFGWRLSSRCKSPKVDREAKPKVPRKYYRISNQQLLNSITAEVSIGSANDGAAKGVAQIHLIGSSSESCDVDGYDWFLCWWSWNSGGGGVDKCFFFLSFFPDRVFLSIIDGTNTYELRC